MLDRSIRELDRERTGLQNQEKKLVMEIKKMAKEGQMVRLLVLPGPPEIVRRWAGWMKAVGAAGDTPQRPPVTEKSTPALQRMP